MFRSVLALSLLTASVFSAASDQATQVESLPLYYTDKGHAYVLADIDRQTQMPMVLDTAANFGVLPPTAKDTLVGSDANLKTINVQGAVGSSQLELLVAGTTKVGSSEVPQLTYVLKDMRPLQAQDGRDLGIIGHGFLSQHCVAFDFKQNVLSLSPAQCSDAAVAGLRQADFYIEEDFVKLKTSFNGQTVDAILDTAAPSSYVNRALFNTLDVAALEQDVARGLNDESVAKNKIGSVSYLLGDVEITDRDMFVSDMPVFAHLGYEDKPVLLLGINYFKGNKLILDYHSNKIYF